jgi:hypothetical protein
VNRVNADDDSSVMNLSDDIETSSEVKKIHQVENMIKETLLEGKQTVNLSSLKLNSSYKNIIKKLKYYSPYLYQFNFTVNEAYSGYIDSVNIKGPNNIDKIKNTFHQVDQELNNILSLISDDMDDERKALVVHDYLVLNTEFDTSIDNNKYSTTDDTDVDSYCAGGLLLNNKAVCYGYANMFQYIMNLLEIECYTTTSTTMCHAWNIIKINNHYYHIDVTWDDPISDQLGKVSHKYFLLSDVKMQLLSHTGWDLTDKVCDDTNYDNYYWNNISSQIITVGNKKYYINYNNRKIIERENDTEKEIIDLGEWNNDETDSYSGLFLYNNELYYNTKDKIMNYSLTTNKQSEIYHLDTSNENIYGIRLKETKIEYVLKENANSENKLYTLSDITLSSILDHIYLDRKQVELNINDSTILNVYSSPSYALSTDEKYIWKSSHNDIATVDQNGVVTAKSSGETIITVTNSDNTMEATCTLTVVHNQHIWNNGTVIQEATCTSKGTILYECTICGDTYTQTINCLAHNWDDGKITNKPTCTKEGIITYTCLVCEKTKTEELKKLGHNYKITVSAKEATCTTAGSTEEKVCTRCGYKQASTVIPVICHSYKEEIIVKPTCEDQGYTVYKCSVCGNRYHGTYTRSLGHTEKSTVTKATLTKNGKSTYICSVCGEKLKDPITIYSPKTIKLSKTAYTYDGKAKKPTVNVTDSKGKKIASSNYTVTYAKGRKNVGVYKVTVKFKGNYRGEKTLTFKINPKGTSVSKLTAKSKSIEVKVKKQATQTTGYEIQYSTDKNFKKSVKTVTIKKNSTVSTTIKKLSAKKKYYVRVRTYKTVSKKKYYSSWSTSQNIVTKK